MFLYVGNDASFSDQLHRDFPSNLKKSTTLEFINEDDLFAVSIVILDVRTGYTLDKLDTPFLAHCKAHTLLIMTDSTEHELFDWFNDQGFLPQYYFTPCSYEGLKQRIEMQYKKRRVRYDKASPLYIPGVEDVFNLKATSNKTLEENYLDHIGSFIMILDMQRQVHYINDAGANLLGYPKEEIIGKNFIENFLPKNFHKEVNDVAESFTTSNRVTITKYTNPVLTKSGEERLIAWTNSSLENSKGEPIALLTSGEDITEQRKAEQNLIELRERQMKLLDALPQYVYMKDRHYKFYMVNKAFTQTVGLPIEEIVGKEDFDLFPEEVAKEFRTVDERIAKSLGSEEIEERYYLHDGDKVETLYAMKRALLDHDGNFEGILGVSWNITEQKEQERLALRQQRLAQMGEMISMIAHQWRQPLMSITAITSNVLLKSALNSVDSSELKHNMHAIERQITFLSETINDFRNFFKPNKAKEHISLKEVMEKVTLLFGGTLKTHGVALTITVEDDSKILTYKNELIQVILTLMQNAIDVFKERAIENPEIRVTISRDAQYSKLVLEDNGGGVDEGLIDKIYEPYFSTKNEQQGTGLGLYMARSIIEEHCQGHLGVANTTSGLCFTIAIPQLKEESE